MLFLSLDFFLDFLKYSTRCPKTAMMIFSMKMTSGLHWSRMGKKHTNSMIINYYQSFLNETTWRGHSCWSVILLHTLAGPRKLQRLLHGWKVTRWALSAGRPVNFRCLTLQLWRGSRKRWIKSRWMRRKRLQPYSRFQMLCVVWILSALSSYSSFIFQVKKSTKKVRVTVKPHLLFRVSTSVSVGLITLLSAVMWNTFAASWIACHTVSQSSNPCLKS